MRRVAQSRHVDARDGDEHGADALLPGQRRLAARRGIDAAAVRVEVVGSPTADDRDARGVAAVGRIRVVVGAEPVPGAERDTAHLAGAREVEGCPFLVQLQGPRAPG